MKKILWPLFLAALTLGMPSCSDDETDSTDPEGTVTLNMMDEENGKTLLGDSGIYIDKGQNFVAVDSNYDLFVLGKASGLGGVAASSFDTRAEQAAVQAGYGYAAVRRDDQMGFPSGKQALKIGDSRVKYMKLYVVSPLSQADKTVGAAVKYAVVMPETHGLPEYGSTVLTIDHSVYHELGQKVSLSLPTGDTEYILQNEGYKIYCERRGRNLVFRLEEWFTDKLELYLRIGESYTKVNVEVNLPL